MAHAIVAEVGIIVGTRPSATVDSGHGLHAYWPIEDGHVVGGDITAARALLRRFGRLVKLVAKNHHVKVDNVYDLARMMRVPGTNNCKNINGHGPIPVVAHSAPGGPLTMAELDERLTEAGIDEHDDDRAPNREAVSPPTDWLWAERTCAYGTKMIDGWKTDTPTARNPWHYSNRIRLACAHRSGCITEADYQRADEILTARLTELVATTGTPRPLGRFEISGAVDRSIEVAAAKTDDEVRAELGHHAHDGDPWGTGGGQQADRRIEPGSAVDDRIRAFRFPDGHRPTDVGNAARLLHMAAGRIRYVHAWGKWLVYQQGRWIIDEKNALVTEIAKEVPRGLYVLAAKTAATDPGEAKLVWKWALSSDTSGAIAAMIRLARGATGILVDHEDLDADPWTLNVANGTIDLRTGHLREHDPAELCTLQAPIAYDPDATAPLWEKCVERWQPDDAVRDYVQLRAGAGATGVPTETVDVDYGLGGNGKSKFHGAIQHVLGPYATVPHKSLIVAGRFEQHATVVADLFRKRCAVASETKQAEDLDDESVKNLTGGDRLKGRRMREDSWEFWPTHTLIMFSNHKPTVQGRDEGIWRRLRLVPWQVTIPESERDEHLAAKLQAEAPGILKWIIDGAVRYHREGLNPPAAVRNATDQYRRDEDVIGRFVADVLEFDPHAWCYSSDLKAELDDWCAEQGIATIPRMHEVVATLRQQGCKDGGRKKIHGKRSTIWHGVCVTQNGGETP